MKAGHPCGDACGMQRSCSSPTKPPTHSARDEQPDAAAVKLPPEVPRYAVRTARPRLVRVPRAYSAGQAAQRLRYVQHAEAGTRSLYVHTETPGLPQDVRVSLGGRRVRRS